MLKSHTHKSASNKHTKSTHRKLPKHGPTATLKKTTTTPLRKQHFASTPKPDAEPSPVIRTNTKPLPSQPPAADDATPQQQTIRVDKSTTIVMNPGLHKSTGTAPSVAQHMGYEILAPKTYTPKTIVKGQLPQHPFTEKVGGVNDHQLHEIYAVDTKTWDKSRRDDWVPGGTLIASLAALTTENWGTAGMLVWCAAGVAAGWNLWARTSLVRRVSVELSNKADHNKYPPTGDQPGQPQQIKGQRQIANVFIEYKPLPFSHPAVEKVPIIDGKQFAADLNNDKGKESPKKLMLQRHYDASFEKDFVTLQDVEAACLFPSNFALNFSVGDKPMMLYMDNIRDLNMVNQLLARSTFVDNYLSKRRKTRLEKM